MTRWSRTWSYNIRDSFLHANKPVNHRNIKQTTKASRKMKKLLICNFNTRISSGTSRIRLNQMNRVQKIINKKTYFPTLRLWLGFANGIVRNRKQRHENGYLRVACWPLIRCGFAWLLFIYRINLIDFHVNVIYSLEATRYSRKLKENSTLRQSNNFTNFIICFFFSSD